MKPLAPFALVALALAAALAAPGCRSAMSAEEEAAVANGSRMRWELKSYHLIYSEHRGPVGYMKVYDVTEAGGPAYTWKYVLDKDLKKIGWVDQFGNAYLIHQYPRGSMPDPREGERVIRLPSDSIQRNTMRMLGIDPALDNVSFPVAKEGDIR